MNPIQVMFYQSLRRAPSRRFRLRRLFNKLWARFVVVVIAVAFGVISFSLSYTILSMIEDLLTTP